MPRPVLPSLLASQPLLLHPTPPFPMSKPVKYRFSFGPWNISEGADPFGPEVRNVFPHEKKFALYKPLGFDGVQFHDDDVVPGVDDLTPAQVTEAVRQGQADARQPGTRPRVRGSAPVVRAADGGWRATPPTARRTASTRWSARCAPSTSRARSARKATVLWLAREGTYIRESKNARVAYRAAAGDDQRHARSRQGDRDLDRAEAQ